jgi:hypothetical protein
MGLNRLVVAAVAIGLVGPIGYLSAQQEKEQKQRKTVVIQVQRQRGAEEQQKEAKQQAKRAKKKQQAESREQRQGKKPAEEQGEKVAYIGVALEPVPEVLVHQLPGLIAKGQGLVVAKVEPGSPAEKAGVKRHDVIVTYDDQKVFAAEQLVKLVRADQPGRRVTLGIVRAGKLIKVTVRLGERVLQPGEPEPWSIVPPIPRVPAPWRHDWPKWREEFEKQMQEWREQQQRWLDELRKQFPHEPKPPKLWQRPPEKKAPKRAGKPWTSFSAVAIQKLDANRYRVQLQFKDAEGKIVQMHFEGTKRQILDELKDKQIPEPVADHLRHSLESLPEIKIDAGEDVRALLKWNIRSGGFRAE